MLPLLPALILLLLKGPAGLERLAWDGQLPHQLRASALDALHRQIARSPEKTDGRVFASLLAARGDKDMSLALLRILSCAAPIEPEPTLSHVPVQDAIAPRIDVPSRLGTPQDGYFACRRSRDGPAALTGSSDRRLA